MKLLNKINSFLIYKVTAGFVRLLSCKRSYTLYIGLFLIISVHAQNMDMGLYRITDTLYNDTVYLNEQSLLRFQKSKVNEEGKSVIEFLKDSLFTDTVIQKIRTYPVDYFSSHGGTFDHYMGTMKNGVYERIHHYGSSVYTGTYNDDKYFKNGKMIAWIRSEYLPHEPNGPIGIHFYLFTGVWALGTAPAIETYRTKAPFIDEK